MALAALVAVAGTRWRVEESFQSSKDLAGLDEHQVRCWRSWHRWTVLAMLARAFLSVMTASQTRAAVDTIEELIPLPATRFGDYSPLPSPPSGPLPTP
ncbi:hypothetical protein JJ691_16280 [Kutzneria sp. CA-103260]|nr:hypothetical protein [Kutzneria sp. CA-103260]QUQ63911.1 hypothetical protein JJ691_16280 [Kutzneria sp. CA-103260]